MKRSTALHIFKYLFHKLEPPLYVLGQEQCNVLKCKARDGKLVNYKLKDLGRDLFLKSLKKLFNLENSLFSIGNTFIVDDKLAKHVTNHPQNVVLFDS